MKNEESSASSNHQPVTLNLSQAQAMDVRNIAGDYHDRSSKKVRTTVYVNRPGESARTAFDRLEEWVAHGAAHDSADRGPSAPKCHPETRRAVQHEIMGWIEHGGEGKILLLSGPAGSGKTAIAGTIADECHSRGWLAGSFFFSAFSSLPERRSKRALMPTLTFHLLHQASIPLLKDNIISSIDADKSVFEKNLVQQLRLLILNPMRQLGSVMNKGEWPKVIIVDGLDECDADIGREYDTEGERRKTREDNHSEVLSALWAAATDPAFPFRIIVASRPERSIQGFFTRSDVKAAAKIIFLDSKYDPTTDIETFVRASLIRIGLNNRLGEDWFSRDVPRLLAQEASGQFIYATTIIRFIEVSDTPPTQQLRCVLEWHRSRPASPNPFAKLDALYLAILNTSSDAILAAKWLRTIEYLDYPDPWFVRALLESSPSETEFILGGSVQSLVGLEDASGDPSFQFYHKSLLDCLGDPSRSAELYVDDEDLKVFLQDRYYQILKDRGPQRDLRRSKITLGAFFNFYQGNSVGHFDPSRGYTDSDVDWWISLSSCCGSTCDHHHFSEMRDSMHAKCPWHHCLPSCKTWKKGISRHRKSHGQNVTAPA